MFKHINLSDGLLRQLGVANDKLRIVVLTDQIRRIIHAVLAVYVPGDI